MEDGRADDYKDEEGLSRKKILILDGTDGAKLLYQDMCKLTISSGLTGYLSESLLVPFTWRRENLNQVKFLLNNVI